MYYRPSQRQHDCDRTVSGAKKLAGNRPLLVPGDFNAPHTLWGYKFISKKGKDLVRAMEDQDLVLLNEQGVVMRKGNSVARDTTPDLSWLAGSLDASWRCEEVDLGSDYSIISITVRGSEQITARICSDHGADHGLGQNEKLYPRKRRRSQGRRVRAIPREMTGQGIGAQTEEGPPKVYTRGNDDDTNAMRRLQAGSHVGGPSLAYAPVETPTA